MNGRAATHRKSVHSIPAPIAASALCIAWALGLLWATTGLLKLWHSAADILSHPVSFFVGGTLGNDADWSQTFPAGVILGVSLAEILAAWWIATGRYTRGIMLGIAMLAAFFAAIMIWPIPPGSSCGCAGSMIELPGTPISRIALLGGMHAFALAALKR